jgi:rhodanese-related sulfurtransferase
MNNQLIPFIANHWPLCLAFLAVLTLILINELLIQKQGPKQLTPDTMVHAINRDKAILIDMRDNEAFRQSHIINAKHMASPSAETLSKYKTKPFVLICARGLQSSPLAMKLRKQGFTDIMVLTGGISAWTAAGLPLVKGKKEAKKAKASKKSKA